MIFKYRNITLACFSVEGNTPFSIDMYSLFLLVAKIFGVLYTLVFV